MRSGYFTMSMKDIERMTIIRELLEKRLTERSAAEKLGLTTRQVRRLKKAYRKTGVNGILSKRFGKCGSNQHGNKIKERVMDLIKKHYADFGPTLAAEKLKERDGIAVNKETIRCWMMEWDLWKAKRHKKVKVHQSRLRRAAFGELIQLDGSHHDWFEGRGKRCCLLVLIDDATSQLVGLRFEEGETTAGYFNVIKNYITVMGRPLAFYSDKDSIFRCNMKTLDDTETQFGRAMRELGIESICANSSQAKGRVERANSTCQDRLVKEMRLRGISNIEEANAYSPDFMADWNKRFTVEPRSRINAHQKELPDAKTLELIFSFQHGRKLSKNLETSYKNKIYQIKTEKIGYHLRHAAITIYEHLSGEITLGYQGKILQYVCHEKQKQSAEIISAKQLEMKCDKIKRVIPSKNHPWRTYGKMLEKKNRDILLQEQLSTNHASL